VQPVAIRSAIFCVTCSLFVCCCCVRLPCWVGVCEYRPDVLFVHQGDVFFGLAECCVSDGSEDIEAGFCHSVYVVCMIFLYVLSSVLSQKMDIFAQRKR